MKYPTHPRLHDTDIPNPCTSDGKTVVTVTARGNRFENTHLVRIVDPDAAVTYIWTPCDNKGNPSENNTQFVNGSRLDATFTVAKHGHGFGGTGDVNVTVGDANQGQAGAPFSVTYTT